MLISNSKKFLIILIPILVVFSSFFYFFYFDNKLETPTIRIGYQPYVSGQNNIFISMKRLKLLEKKGYTSIYIPFLSGPPLNEAIIAEKIDIGFGGDLPTISLLASGAQVKIIGVGAKTLRQALIIDNEKTHQIKEIKDLKGKIIALVKGSASHYFFVKLLRENGINPKDVKIIHMEVKDQPFALTSNKVDGIVTWEPWPTKIEKEKIGKIFIEGEYSGFIYAHEKLINKNPDKVKAFIEAFQEALEYTQKNLFQTCQWVSEETKESVEVVFEAAKTDSLLKNEENIKPDLNLMKKLEFSAYFLFEEGFIQKIPDFNSKIEWKLLNEAIIENRD